MPHIMDQWQMGVRIPDSLREFKKNKHATSTPQGEDYCDVATRSIATTPASSTLATFSQSPQQTKFNPLPTPVSSISAVFESPQRTSPSSSFSSSHSIITSQVNKTAIAELEDTSPGHKLVEMEDTSEVATQTSRMSSRDTTAGGTSRTLLATIDQHLSNLEQENLQLRNALRTSERNLTVAKQAAEDAHIAYKAVKEVLEDREYELEYKKSIIAGLEKEADHCRQHHLPPPTPSKSERNDLPISRFNIDAKRATASHTAPLKSAINRTSSATSGASPKTIAANVSCTSPSASGSPLAKPYNPAAWAPSSNPYRNPASRSLSATVAQSASNTQTDDDTYGIFSNREITPLGFERPIASRITNPLSMHPIEARTEGASHNRGHLHSRQKSIPLILLSPKSSPNLRRSQGQSLGFPSSVNLVQRHNQAQPQTPSLHSANYPGTGSYSSMSSSASLLHAQHVQSQNQDRKQKQNEEQLPIRERSEVFYLPSGGLPVNSSSRMPSVLSAPPNTTTFPSPNALGALSTLPSQVRARANSFDRQNIPRRGQGVGQAPAQAQDTRQRKRGAVSEMFRSKDRNSTANGGCEIL